ncbi:Leucine-rich repeat-containing protein 59 [Amphibalanus amphitrite]|uniref:Leucine-rich repeat protein soc-2 homolog n=1 Tax=Amphibalanus amphitrite TaxID=1232801 RepID=A0A6A4X5Z1_AMPAM|nr:Leucine-rich repeat-containing protein 59 [Amphibalanus amphitrite]
MAETKNPLKDKLNDDELDLSICNYADKDVPVKDIALLKRANKLDLSNNKLIGLPKTFATLTHLVKLDLSCNLIVELPTNFGELERLKHLDLYNNKNNPLSSQLAAAAGECLNPKECEQCARRVVQFMGRVKEHYDQERIRRQQHEKGSGGLSFVGKLNLVLLLTAVALVGGALYLQQRGGRAPSAGLPADLAGRAVDFSVRAFERVSELGTNTGDLLVKQTLAVWRWGGELATQIDLYLTHAFGESWHSTKAAAGNAGTALSRVSRRAGEQSLALLSYAVRRAWESAGPLWEAACDQAARLRQDAGPLLIQWTEAGWRALVDFWAAVQREAPGYAAAAWEVACRVAQGVWMMCSDGWEVVSTQVPVYASLAAERLTKLVASVTGG